MSLTLAELELLMEEMAPAIVEGFIQQVFEVDPSTFILRVRQPGETRYLFVSTESGFTRMHLTTGKRKQPPKPSPFTMQLRKWLHSARIIEARLLSDDRVVRIELDAPDQSIEDPGDGPLPRVDMTLIVELTGRHGNVFLLDAADVVIGRQHEGGGDRQLEPGDQYVAPPRPDDLELSRNVRWSLDERPRTERSELVEKRFEEERREKTRRELEKDLRRRLKRRAKKFRRRKKHVEGDLERAEEAETYRIRGELLQSAYGQVEPGAEMVRVPNYYSEEMEEVEIPLDPSRSLQANIDRYFHEYRRMNDATDRIEERLLETMDLIEETEEARERLDTCETIADLEGLRAEVVDSGVLEPPREETRRARQEKRAPYREFRSTHGKKILVGRGAKQNDELTTTIARGRDMWLHARNWAGAHVILRMRKDEDPDGEDLRDAAVLAAHFSKGSEDSLIDVTYTRAKHVSKPGGAAPGLVTIAGGSTIAVGRDEDRLERVLATEQ